MQDPGGSTNELDGNFYLPNGAPLGKNWRGHSGSYSSLGAARQASGGVWEVGGLEGEDPGLVQVSGDRPDAAVVQGSVLIDAAVVIPASWPDSVQRSVGGGWDIGAVEFGVAVVPPTASPTAFIGSLAPTPQGEFLYQIDCGATQSHDGWLTDEAFTTTGDIYKHPFSNPSIPFSMVEVYSNERYGTGEDLIFQLPVQAGSKLIVTLFFTEALDVIINQGAGGRVMGDISLDGVVIIPAGLDIVAAAGGGNIPYVVEKTVTASASTMELRQKKGSADNQKINGISVRKADSVLLPSPTPNQAITPTSRPSISPDFDVTFRISIIVERPSSKLSGEELNIWLNSLLSLLGAPREDVTAVVVESIAGEPFETKVSFNTKVDYTDAVNLLFSVKASEMAALDIIIVDVEKPDPPISNASGIRALLMFPHLFLAGLLAMTLGSRTELN